MRRMLVLSLAAAAACGGPSHSKVLIDWTFEGKSCADVGVTEIRFAIDNEVLTQDHFTCQEAAVGVDLGVFLVGDYRLTIEGLDGAVKTTHRVVQTLQVRGGRGGVDEFAVDVPRVANSTTADLTWTFSPGPDCATANVQQVTIFVDPDPNFTTGNVDTVACSTMGTQGASIAPLTPGTHTFAIVGLRSTSNGLTPVYRTHTLAQGFFQEGLTTSVVVRAEPTP
jgi:hypothetical protein